MISLYRPGRSILHRLPAGWKLIGLAVLALAVSLAGRSWPVLAGAAIVTVLGFLATGFGLGELWRQLYTLRWLVVIMIIRSSFFSAPRMR